MMALTIGPHTFFFFKSYCSTYDLVSVLILNQKFPEWLMFIFVQLRQRPASNSTLLFFSSFFSFLLFPQLIHNTVNATSLLCLAFLLQCLALFISLLVLFVFSFSPSVYDRTPGFTHARPAFGHEGTNAALSFRFAQPAQLTSISLLVPQFLEKYVPLLIHCVYFCLLVSYYTSQF